MFTDEDILASFEGMCCRMAVPPENEAEALDDGLTIVEDLGDRLTDVRYVNRRKDETEREFLRRLARHGESRRVRFASPPPKWRDPFGDRSWWDLDKRQQAARAKARQRFEEQVVSWCRRHKLQAELVEVYYPAESRATSAAALRLPNPIQMEEWDQEEQTTQLLRVDKNAATFESTGGYITQDSPTRNIYGYERIHPESTDE